MKKTGSMSLSLTSIHPSHTSSPQCLIYKCLRLIAKGNSCTLAPPPSLNASLFACVLAALIELGCKCRRSAWWRTGWQRPDRSSAGKDRCWGEVLIWLGGRCKRGFKAVYQRERFSSHLFFWFVLTLAPKPASWHSNATAGSSSIVTRTSGAGCRYILPFRLVCMSDLC
jgi:hypothetical protein